MVKKNKIRVGGGTSLGITKAGARACWRITNEEELVEKLLQYKNSQIKKNTLFFHILQNPIMLNNIIYNLL